LGYTHYWWTRWPALPAEAFDKVVHDFKKLLPEFVRAGVVLAGMETDGVPTVCTGEISFNGKGPYGHEAFRLLHIGERPGRDGRCFEFCKTACKPYDLAVTACLVIAKHHLGDDIEVASDGSSEDWRDAKTLCQAVLGYGVGVGVPEPQRPITPPDGGLDL